MDQEKHSYRKGQRLSLSTFLCRELFYDYLAGQLDPLRKKAVEDCLGENIELQHELDAQREAFDYTQQLAQAQVSKSFLKKVKERQSRFDLALKKLAWRNWPDPLRWSSEALIISIFAAVIATMVPWKKFNNILPKPATKPIILVEKEHIGPRSNGAIDDPNSEEYEKILKNKLAQNKPDDVLIEEKIKLAVENLKSTNEKIVSEAIYGGANVAIPLAANEVTQATETVDDAGQEVQTSVAQAESETQQEAAKISSQVESNVAAKKTKSVKVQATRKAPAAFVYRAFMSLSNIDVVNAMLIKEVESRGGTRAGEVELGWRKPDGSYFHFSMPESNYEDLLVSLRHFGPVRIYKDPHWRVMPEGQIRIILWIEDKDAKSSDI